jgi:hypothetical protein
MKLNAGNPNVEYITTHAPQIVHLSSTAQVLIGLLHRQAESFIHRSCKTVVVIPHRYDGYTLLERNECIQEMLLASVEEYAATFHNFSSKLGGELGNTFRPSETVTHLCFADGSAFLAFKGVSRCFPHLTHIAWDADDEDSKIGGGDGEGVAGVLSAESWGSLPEGIVLAVVHVQVYERDQSSWKQVKAKWEDAICGASDVTRFEWDQGRWKVVVDDQALYRWYIDEEQPDIWTRRPC